MISQTNCFRLRIKCASSLRLPTLFSRFIHNPGQIPTPESIRKTLSPELESALAVYPSLIQIPVHWGDQDAYGHVNNVIYLRYAETGRLGYFEQILRPHLPLQEYLEFSTGKGIGPIVKSLDINFKSPVLYPDTVIVGTRILPESIQVDRFRQAFVIASLAQNKIVANGHAVGVTFDYRKGRKAPIPPQLLKAYRTGEGLD